MQIETETKAIRCALLAILIIIFIVLVNGCMGVEVDLPPDRDNIEGSTVDEFAVFPVLSTMAIGIEYDDDIESHPGGFSCSQSVEIFTLLLEGLETEKPYIVGTNGVVRCDPVEEDITSWYIECRWYTPPAFIFPSYWTHFYFTVDKLRWDEKEYIGLYTQVIEVVGHFYCIRYFRITDAELTYVYY